MSDALLRLDGDGSLKLSGVIDFTNGAALRQRGRELIESASAIDLHVDCSAVDRSSSVGLSLLLCWMRDAHRMGKKLTISGLPEDMLQIAGVSELLDILPLQDAAEHV